MPGLLERLKRHERWWPIAFFLAGFIYDIFSLGGIDSAFEIVRRSGYLLVISAILGFEIVELAGKFSPRPQGWIAKAWNYHEHAIHFLLGSLLSEYTLFFFKSSSLRTSFLFMAVLAALLVINEFKRFEGHSGVPVRAALFSLCLVSFFVALVPVALGFVGAGPFLLALVASGAYMAGFTRVLRPKLGEKRGIVSRQLHRPFGGVVSVFVLLYFTHLIPPVPLAIQYIGIFHEVKKEGGNYVLGYSRPAWKFWQNGDQSFVARPGDRIYSFARIFSPGGFKDEVKVRWLMKDPRHGWQGTDAVPLPVTGGREQGFRGYVYKANWQPGDWQVRVETAGGLEIGRIYFSVEADPDPAAARELRYESQ